MSDSMWLVKSFMSWRRVTGRYGGLLARMAESDDGNIGFCPVFDTRKAAEEWADGAELQEIKVTVIAPGPLLAEESCTCVMPVDWRTNNDPIRPCRHDRGASLGSR